MALSKYKLLYICNTNCSASVVADRYQNQGLKINTHFLKLNVVLFKSLYTRYPKFSIFLDVTRKIKGIVFANGYPQEPHSCH